MKNEVKVGLASVAAMAAGATAAVAGAAHPAAPAPAPAHPVDTGYNWTGFYIGGSYGMLAGDLAWYSGYDYTLDKGYLPGVFVGYNQTLSNGVVIGAELEKQWPKMGVEGNNTSYPSDYGYSNLTDAKFKVGMPILADKRLMVYGFGGISGGKMSSANTNAYSAFGVNYGVGAEFAITNNIHIGAEIIGRSLEGYALPSDTYANQQASVRLSFHF